MVVVVVVVVVVMVVVVMVVVMVVVVAVVVVVVIKDVLINATIEPLSCDLLPAHALIEERHHSRTNSDTKQS